ncbi:MAG: AAA family ATPase [Chloroflexi bacterium]|nr:AAA family ATPase [Chloroflexota bacterium]
MKIAISGKGGVGKTLLAALLSHIFAQHGYSVLAIDGDPDANLAATLGFPHPEQILPISEMKDLVEERTGTRPGKLDPYFKLNPKVDDIPEKYAHKLDSIRLMRMGQIKQGGSGCYCPENALLKALVAHLLLARNEIIIMDMAAGIEHLGRGTARAVDILLIVVEPGSRSLETARNIIKLAKDLGLPNIAVVANKVRNEADKKYLTESLPGLKFLGFLPYDQAIVNADLARQPVVASSLPVRAEAERIFAALQVTEGKPGKSG